MSLFSQAGALLGDAANRYREATSYPKPICRVMVNGRDITLDDGTKLFLGSSGTGAPWELARPGVDTVDDPR